MLFKIQNGSVSFGADTVLENIEFEIQGREKVAIVGRNGCGKSTLLKCISGELSMEEGTLLWKGQKEKTSPYTETERKQHNIQIKSIYIFLFINVSLF